RALEPELSLCGGPGTRLTPAVSPRPSQTECRRAQQGSGYVMTSTWLIRSAGRFGLHPQGALMDFPRQLLAPLRGHLEERGIRAREVGRDVRPRLRAERRV